jgi:hypothetical protein
MERRSAWSSTPVRTGLERCVPALKHMSFHLYQHGDMNGPMGTSPVGLPAVTAFVLSRIAPWHADDLLECAGGPTEAWPGEWLG